ncbi:MAG: hypothetical protein IIW35_02310 [Bacteroidaceae bacterium]|nr:hypothetical protein [Bacteroidaceae bacterium]MBQ5817167.1 hypothetical protein [Bacteroidaceae bacterium]
MTQLIDIVRKDVFEFLENNDELLFNERDFQMHLATWLQNSMNNYDDVDVEYYVPWQELNGYIWESELRLDIVVKKDGEYCPVELKYKTKKVERNISRFGESVSEKVVVMKNQGAQDLGMYDFWKDVRRVELVRNRFKNVKGGLAVFVTNDAFYPKGSKSTSNNYMLNITDGDHSPIKHWQNENSSCANMKAYKSFEVEQTYNIKWHQKTVKDVEFHYFIVTI